MTSARVQTVVDTVFGQQLVDPYRWMEEGPELREWLLAQGEKAEQHLAELPLRAELLARLNELTEDTAEISAFAMAGDRVFFLRQAGDLPVLVVYEGDEERVILDPGTLGGDVHSSIDWYEPSPDGSLVVCGISQGGAEMGVAHVLDVATGELTPTGLAQSSHGHPVWLPDGSGFFCHRYRDPDPNLPADRRRDDSATCIPTGGALVRRPDLFAAMVSQVAVFNTTRMEFTENGPVNAPEFGTQTTEEGLRALLIVDSYLRVVDGAEYPAVLLTVGLNDPRVAAWQPAKMGARLQAATTSDRPVLIRVEEHGGHGFGSTREQRNALTADVYAFLAAQLAR